MNKNTITVEEFTTPSPKSVETTSTLPEIWNLMRDAGIRHVLVRDDNKVVGIVSERDVTTFSQAAEFEKIQAQDVMSKDILTVTPDTKLFEVALQMSEQKVGSTIVQDSENQFTGIFTATDALNALVEVLRGDLS